MDAVDVLIAGGGPAGCAAAIALRMTTPALHVAVVDGGAPQRRQLGETLPPAAATLLRHLGVHERFVAEGHAAAYRTQSAWGTSDVVAEEYLERVHQVGWRIDRARFDAMLAEAARSRGAEWRRTSVIDVERDDALWRVRCADGETIAARFVIDATGRDALLCRRLNLEPERLDRLLACVGRYPPAAQALDMTIEACADGWWYATTLPDGQRVVACMSDSDIVRRERLARLEPWLATLSTTRHLRDIVGDAEPLAPPQLYAATSCRRALPDLAFLAAGDAVAAFDPLSSQGVAQALRSGVFAAYAAGDFVARGDPRGLARYRRFMTDEYAAYARTLGEVYGRERRWAERPFWQRRHALTG